MSYLSEQVYLIKNILLTFLILCFFASHVEASLSKEAAIEKLLLIKSFSRAAPERSRTEIINSTDYRMLLNDIDQVDWLFHSVKVANRLNDIQLYEDSLKSLYEFGNMFSPSQVRDFLLLLGHFNLKLSYFVEANKAYVCANKNHSKHQIPIQSLYSLSIVNSYLKNMIFAEELMMIVHKELAKEKSDTKLAVTSNALGVFALHKKDYETASEHFRKSMDIHQKTGSLSGEYNAGLNLLLSYVLNKNLTFYNRLIKRIERFNKQHNDPDKKLYFELIIMLANVIESENYSELDTKVATSKINEIESATIKTATVDFIAPHLGVNIVHPKEKLGASPQWVIDILNKEKCFSETLDYSIFKNKKE